MQFTGCVGPTRQKSFAPKSLRMAFMNTIFGASAMSNNQPPAANRQFREVVVRICHLSASKRQRIDAPDSSVPHGAPAPCVSILRRFPSMTPTNASSNVIFILFAG